MKHKLTCALLALLALMILPSCKTETQDYIASPETLSPPTLVSEGYFVKAVDLYGRQTYRIGEQRLNVNDEFCILSSPSFSDIFNRYPVSILRTDQLYKLYTCEFSKSDSYHKDSWVETVWGIEAISENATLGMDSEWDSFSTPPILKGELTYLPDNITVGATFKVIRMKSIGVGHILYDLVAIP